MTEPKKCIWHLCNNLARVKFCSIKCKNKYHVSLKRRSLKLKAIEYKGGQCERCGYNKCVGALEFHHQDPTLKSFGLGDKGYTRSWVSIKEELDKCILLCANCHREVEEELRVP
jgi:hypothetical protein